ncbi:CZB domain-containing protein [Helicobacter suis]|uniref:CZB domain-containing protein n=1 Tax=Helicobacter suis TaxID=104628 RepID=UPI001F082053
MRSLLQGSLVAADTANYSIENLNNLAFCCLAKTDHVVYKGNLYGVIFDIPNHFKIVDNHNCRLGKWYYEGDGKKHFSHMPSYRSMEACHKEVHDSANALVEQLKDRSKVSSETIEKAVSAVERSSKEVHNAIDRISQEKSEELQKKIASISETNPSNT